MKALVITPFSPAENNAGHRVRVAQVNEFLRGLCDELDCVFLPFEGGHGWQVDTPEVREISHMFDRTYVLPAQKAGRIPVAGDKHELDEWFEPLFGAFFEALAKRSSYSIVVVHNVWLSKALGFFPPAALKWLELHDLFHLRAEAFGRLGRNPDFFTVSKPVELFGIARSDLAVSISDEEFEYLQSEVPDGNTQMVLLPCDPVSDEHALINSDRDAYLHENKVVFGLLGSAHPFNTNGLQELLRALAISVGRSMAPVEVLVAGQVSGALRGQESSYGGLCKPLGYVDDIDEFYNSVDFVVVPVFDGSGVNIKLTEAVRRGLPVLASSLVLKQAALKQMGHGYADASAMAAEMCKIALRRPPRIAYLFQSKRESRTLGKKRRHCEQNLTYELTRRRRTLHFDTTHIIDPRLERLCVAAVVSFARGNQGVAEYSVRVSPPLYAEMKSIRSYLPLFFSVCDEAPLSRPGLVEADRGTSAELKNCIEDVFSGEKAANLATRLGQRLNIAAQNGGALAGPWRDLAFYCALVEDNLQWEPALRRLIQASPQRRDFPRYICLVSKWTPFAESCRRYAKSALPKWAEGRIEFVEYQAAAPIVTELLLDGLARGVATSELVFLFGGETPAALAVLCNSAVAKLLPAREVATIVQFDALVEACC